MNRIRFAIQKEGRLATGSIRLLEKIGVGPELGSRSLMSVCRDFPIDLLTVRDDDIPEYVSSGVSDLGIVGEDVLVESAADVEILERLGFGRSRLMLLSQPSLKLSSIEDLDGKRIATSYPRIVRNFLLERNLNCEIVQLSGTVEIATRLGLADVVCDLVSTGHTAKLNGLEPKFPVFSSEAVLFVRANWRERTKPEQFARIDELRLRIRSTLKAGSLRYLMLNAPRSSLSQLEALLPGARSPSVLALKNPDLVAVHVVVSELELWDLVPRIHAIGGTDMVCSEVSAYIP